MSAISLAISALALLWLVIAAAVAILAARRFRLAETVLSAARANAALLEAAPARPLIVRPGQRIEVDSHLLRDLGLRAAVRLDDLATSDGGIAEEDLARLASEVETARTSAARLSLKVRTRDSGRVFEIRGGPAPPPEPAGTLLLWFSTPARARRNAPGSRFACARPRARWIRLRS